MEITVLYFKLCRHKSWFYYHKYMLASLGKNQFVTVKPRFTSTNLKIQHSYLLNFLIRNHYKRIPIFVQYSPSYNADPSEMKECPCKRGGLSWGVQFSSIFTISMHLKYVLISGIIGNLLQFPLIFTTR